MSASAIGRATYGELGVSDTEVERIAGALTPAQVAAHGAEIYLGAACAARLPAALAVLERDFIARVPDILAPKRLAPDVVDDIRQTVRERLLAGSPPYIAGAVGRGSLAGLVAVIATRAALDRVRAHQREAARAEPIDDGDADVLAATGDPARDHLRATYRASLKSAFETAIAALPARERTLLRMHLVDGLTIDDVARMYQMHRATAARQIERARETVATATREQLAAKVPANELDEVAALVASQLDLSLSRVLR